MADSGSYVLSDVHVGQDENEVMMSVYVVTPESTKQEDSEERKSFGLVDDDGDLDLPRKRRKQGDDAFVTLSLYHKRETALSDVGLQLWRASLLLGDFISNNSALFRGKRIVELGAGLGLPSLILCQFGCAVTATDFNSTALKYLEKNAVKNMLNTSLGIQKFDWSSHADVVAIRRLNADCFVASDVLYDPISSHAFFKMLPSLLQQGQSLFLAQEQRINFSISTLTAEPTGYSIMADHVAFVSAPKGECTEVACTGVLRGRRLALDFQQKVLPYERVAELDLFEIWSQQPVAASTSSSKKP